jgi:exonuclease SbcC
MFKDLTIKNFQSHKDTYIEFENGVNVLVGSSDQGKSAILRAILWAVNNRPLGTDDIVSHWARDAKNKIADTMLVEIKTEKGIVTRKRTADTNEYVLWEPSKVKGEKLFEAVNKDVPEDIQKFFRLSDVNIQQQHDSPFLLSQSPSDVAKFFNRIVKLDVIDKVLTNAETSRRDLNKKIKNTEQEKINLEKEITSYNWIDTAQVFVEKLANVMEKINVYDDEWQVIDCEVIDYLRQKEFLKKYPDIKTANALIEKIENIKIDYDLVDELEKSIEKYKEVNRDRKIFEMIKIGKNILAEIDLIKPDYETLKLLNSQILEFENARKIREQATIERADLIKQLPDVCPTCGALMKECIE